MARRRRRSYSKYFRRKTKRNVWSKENLQFRQPFSNADPNPPNGPNNPGNIVNPRFTLNLAVCSNGALANAFNIASSTGIRTVKNFTISGALVPHFYLAPDNAAGPVLQHITAISRVISDSPVRWALIYCPQGMI